MTKVRLAVPFFMVDDMERSLCFYVEGLGFEKTKEWTPDGAIEWCWLELDAVAVMLQVYRPGRAPEGKRGLGVTISCQCDEALALYRTFTARGVTATKPFVGNNMWVFSVTDPDGYRLEFESPTDVPEDTEYDSAHH